MGKEVKVGIDVEVEEILKSASPLPWRASSGNLEIDVSDAEGRVIIALSSEGRPEDYLANETDAILIAAAANAIGELVAIAGDCTYKDLSADAVCQEEHPSDRAQWCGACVARTTLQSFVQSVVDMRLNPGR
jgi:hypothetical protein